MNPIAIAQTVIQLLQILNVGVEEARRVWDAIRARNPELPELSTLEIAEMAEGKYQVLLDRIRQQQG